KAGETLVVSGAAGATGSLVVQLGKILGCRGIGTAGSDDKCACLTRELGADAAINYKKSDELLPSLSAACSKGIDVYFENVGGPLLDMVLSLVNPFARIPLCGMISQYNLDPPEPGPRYMFSMIGNRVLMQGFIISDHLNLYPEFLAEVGGWLKSGRIKRDETIVEGIENAPRPFLRLCPGDSARSVLVRAPPGAREHRREGQHPGPEPFCPGPPPVVHQGALGSAERRPDEGVLERRSLMDSRSRYLREGIIAGLIAAAIVAVWFLIYDAARGQPFRTPALLRAAAMQGIRDPRAVAVTPGLVARYTVLHGAIFAMVGVLIAFLIATAQRQPSRLLVMFVALMCFEVAFLAVLTWWAHPVVTALRWWAILIANALAA